MPLRGRRGGEHHNTKNRAKLPAHMHVDTSHM